MIYINIFQGDLSDMSAKKASLVLKEHWQLYAGREIKRIIARLYKHGLRTTGRSHHKLYCLTLHVTSRSCVFQKDFAPAFDFYVDAKHSN